MAGKILIVDDDRDITQIIQLLLEGEGYDTAVAGSCLLYTSDAADE